MGDKEESIDNFKTDNNKFISYRSQNRHKFEGLPKINKYKNISLGIGKSRIRRAEKRERAIVTYLPAVLYSGEN